jgi:glycosyltransferase involved in cell wall biosynthesis
MALQRGSARDSEEGALVAGRRSTDHNLGSMRLAVEITTCTSRRTGVGYYAEHLVDALLETRGADDDIVLLSNRAPAPALAARWAPYLRVSGPHVRALWMQTEVPRALIDARADAAVFPNYAMPLASPCPSIVVVHDLALLRMPQHFTMRKRVLTLPMLKHVAATASVIATVSEASQRDIVTMLGVNPERIALLPGAAHPSCGPADPEALASVRERYQLYAPYVLTVGTLEPRKNLMTILRAFDQLGAAAGGHDLVVVGGRGWKDRGLVRALERRAGSGRVRWLGYVAESDLAALYTGADLFVFAPALEGFGLPLLEAMACGTRVLASDVAALREIGGDAARFVPPGDAGAFARAIEEELSEPRESRQASARAAGLLRAKRFSWSRTAELLWRRARATAPVRVRPAASGTRRLDDGATLPPPLHPLPPQLGSREWALLATVVYADLFESPLAIPQTQRALIGIALDETEVRRLAAGAALSPLVALHPRGFMTLVGREHLVDPLPAREAVTRALLDRNRRTLSALAALPFVRTLLISGGVAHRNAGSKPDVDLFVIAARDRAYTAFTMLFVATKLTGSRRVICPNYVIEEGELPIAYHRDLFTAHQLVSARPFSGHRGYEALCRVNEEWVRRFFPGFTAHAEGTPGDGRPWASAAVQWIGEVALRPTAPALEAVLRSMWRFRLSRRAAASAHADVVLADGILKLHLSDYRPRVLDRFAARLERMRAELGSPTRVPRSSLDPVGT